MGLVVSFAGYQPAARFDDEPWTQAQVEEAASAAGPWTLIDTLALDPVDVDPSDPEVRNLTTENGTAPNRWYRLIYLDGDGDSSEPTAPIENSEPQTGRDLCSLEDVRAYVQLDNDDVSANGALQTLISAESDDFLAYTRRLIRVADPTPAIRTYDVDWVTAEDRELLIEDASEIVSVAIKDAAGSVVDADPARVEMPRNRESFEPITSLWFPAKFAGAAPLEPDNTVEVEAAWGWPSVPDRVRKAVVIFVARSFVRNLGALSDSGEEILPDVKLQLTRDTKWALDVRDSLRIPSVG